MSLTDSTPPKTDLLEIVQQGFASMGVPGICLEVVDRSGTVESISLGTLGPDSKVVLGSTSKCITAIALMRAVEAGHLTLEDPAGEWLPDADLPPSVTVLDLARHCSGLTSDSTPRSHHFAKDRGFRYANENYNLLGQVIASATGVFFDQWVAEQVLEPMGLDSAFCLGSEDSNRTPLGHVGAFGIHVSTRLADYGSDSWIQPASGAMCASARDSGRILRMLMNDGELEGARLLTAQSVHTILRETVPTERSSAVDGPLGPQGDYGVGCIRKSLNGEEVFLHVGKVPTHTTVFALIPGQELAFALVADTGDFLVTTPLIEELADSIIRLLLGDALKSANPGRRSLRRTLVNTAYLGAVSAGFAGWLIRHREGSKAGILGYHFLLPLVLVFGVRRASGTPFIWLWRFAPDASGVLCFSAANMVLSGIWRVFCRRRQNGN